MNFQTYGEFHIRPIVTNLKDNSELVQGSATGYTLNSFKLIEANPEGGEGVNIFDVAPTHNKTLNLLSGMMGLRKGYAIYELNLTIPAAVTGGSEPLTLATRLEFNMDNSLYTSYYSQHALFPTEVKRRYLKIFPL